MTGIMNDSGSTFRIKRPLITTNGFDSGLDPRAKAHLDELNALLSKRIFKREHWRHEAAAEAAEKPKVQALGNRQGDLRGLLDKLLQASSSGEAKLGPEPDQTTQLPEEAQEGDIENQELDQNLLNDKPESDGQEKQVLVGDRMARSRQRLALNNDPGKVTQAIQKRIIIDLDNLIEQARQQQAQTRNQKPSNKPGEKMPAPGEQQQQASNSKPQAGVKPQTGTTPAGDSYKPGQGQSNTDVTKNIVEEAREWGGLSPRQRADVLQGADDQVL